MTEGPPPTEATSSKASIISNSQQQPQSGVPRGPTNYTPWYTTSYTQYKPQPATAGSSTHLTPTAPYPQTSNPYAAHYALHPHYPHQPSPTYVSQPSNSSFPPSSVKSARKPLSPSPSPPPPDPETYKHWDLVIRAFLLKMGLTQALKGFEADMLVFNPEWEQMKVPQALEEMIKGLSAIVERRASHVIIENEGQAKDAMQVDIPPQLTTTASSTPLQPKLETSTESLETRKLTYVHLTNGAQPHSQSSINKSISLFLAQNKARNDASNRAEFLSSLTERRKRQRMEDGGHDSLPPSIDSREATGSDIAGKEAGTCARVDAKPIDRDAQMKYDITKDDWGPLSRSAKAGLPSEVKSESSPLEEEAIKPESMCTTAIKKEGVSSDRLPGLDERLKNIEDHIAVRFVPNPPRTLLARLKFLEDHLIKLEKEYPPWAALHFNQPGRGWPPPPRTTPLIVPLHLRDTTAPIGSTSIESTTTPMDTDPAASSGSGLGLLAQPSGAARLISSKSNSKAKVKIKVNPKNNKPKSSLHRAVMEKLEVQKAMNDLGT